VRGRSACAGRTRAAPRFATDLQAQLHSDGEEGGGAADLRAHTCCDESRAAAAAASHFIGEGAAGRRSGALSGPTDQCAAAPNRPPPASSLTVCTTLASVLTTSHASPSRWGGVLTRRLDESARGQSAPLRSVAPPCPSACWGCLVGRVPSARRPRRRRSSKQEVRSLRASLAVRHCAIAISPYVLTIAQRISIGQFLRHMQK